MATLDATVRPLSAADLPALGAARVSWARSGEAMLRSQESGAVIYLVALVNGSPAGVAEFVHSSDPAQLRNVHVLAASRGNGIGTALIKAAEDRAAGELRLEVASDNPRARRLYERLGYRATGEQRQVTYTYLDDHGHERQATELEIVLSKTDLPR